MRVRGVVYAVRSVIRDVCVCSDVRVRQYRGGGVQEVYEADECTPICTDVADIGAAEA